MTYTTTVTRHHRATLWVHVVGEAAHEATKEDLGAFGLVPASSVNERTAELEAGMLAITRAIGIYYEADGHNDVPGDVSGGAPERVWVDPYWSNNVAHWEGGNWSAKKPHTRILQTCKSVQYLRLDVYEAQVDACRAIAWVMDRSERDAQEQDRARANRSQCGHQQKRSRCSISAWKKGVARATCKKCGAR